VPPRSPKKYTFLYVTKHLPSASVYVPGPLLCLFLNFLLLFFWLSPVPWFPLSLFIKFYSSYSVTVCVPILFIHFRSITYKLLAATVFCSYFSLLPVHAQQITCFWYQCSVFLTFVNHCSLSLSVLFIHPSFPQLFHSTSQSCIFSPIYVVVLISAELFLSS